MILYHCSTTYHVLCSIVHKLVYHPHGEAVLLIVEYLYPKPELNRFISRLKETGWFVEILIVPEKEFAKARTKKLGQYSSYEQVKQQAKQISNAFEEWFPFSVNEFREIYLLGEQWSFGIYILYHQIPHNYFEDGSGLLGDYQRYFQVVRDINMTNYVLLRYLGGGGKNSFIKKKFCDMKRQPAGFQDEKAVDFCIYTLLSKMQVDEREKLFWLFQAEKLSLPEGKTVAVFLTQFIRTLSIQSVDVQIQFTSLILDYFFKQDILLIKPHPKDKWVDYPALYPEAVMIDKLTPSEFLPLLLNRPVDLTITASSTSIGGMSYITKDSISFGPDIESDFMCLHMDYAAARLVSMLEENYKVVLPEEQRNFVRQFLKSFKNEGKTGPETSKKPALIVVNDEEIETREGDAVLYINHRTKEQFLLNQNHPQNFLVITVSVYSLDDFLCDREELLWFYCDDKTAREKVLNWKEEFFLKRSRQEISIKVSEATQIQMEQGKNRALKYVLQTKSNEDRDRILSEMNALVGLYQKESAMFNRVLAEENCKNYK